MFVVFVWKMFFNIICQFDDVFCIGFSVVLCIDNLCSYVFYVIMRMIINLFYIEVVVRGSCKYSDFGLDIIFIVECGLN